MEQAEHKDFRKPDEVREFPKGRLELIAEAPHFQYQVSGVMRIRMDDGTEFDCQAGDVSLLPPGHDAWVVGNEPAVVVDFQGMIDYAKNHEAHA